MRSARCNQTRRSAEAGVAFIEFAIVSGFLMWLVIGIYDFSMMVSTYVTLEQIAREGVRTAASITPLESDQPYNNSNVAPVTCTDPVAQCASGATTLCRCGHWLVHERIKILVSEAHLSLEADPQITSQYQMPAAYGVYGTNNELDTVSISVTALYRGLIFRNVPLRVTMRGPYLYERYTTDKFSGVS